MGLCRNGPPPDLQYDNSSGTNPFCSFPLSDITFLCFYFCIWYVIFSRKCVNMMSLSSPELFRISTFARFPASGVTERSLARAGWFYTGVGDRVQCFRCNVTAEGWQAGDCPTEKHRQLSPSCSFIQSLPSTANLLSSSHSAFSPLRIAPAIPVRSKEVSYKKWEMHFIEERRPYIMEKIVNEMVLFLRTESVFDKILLLLAFRSRPSCS